MKYLYVFLAMLILMGCAGPDYTYRPGSNASLNHLRFDRDACANKAFNKFFDANPGARLHSSIACCTTPDFISGIVMSSIVFGVKQQTPKGSPMTEADINPTIDRCMAAKGYIEQ